MVPSTRRGICDMSSPQAASSGSDQRLVATSSHSVPDASDISSIASPHSRQRSHALGSSTCRMRANSAGSCWRTHSSFGAVKPGIAALPVIERKPGTAASSCAHCATLRPSSQSMQERSTCPSASTSVAPCIWPARPMARTARSAFGCSAARASRQSQVAAHQSSGSCSDQPGYGRLTASGACAEPITCSPSSSSAFTPEVPRSMPSVGASWFMVNRSRRASAGGRTGRR
jgi:hypothetical protein